MSVAIDSNGVPAVAMFEAGDQSDNEQLLYWKRGTASAVSVYTFPLGSPDVTLAFDGTKPRIAGHMDAPSGATAPDSLVFVASDDGVTWTTPVHLPSNQATQYTAFDSAMALDGQGKVAVVADINGTTGGAGTCGENPYVATASIAAAPYGGAWTACGADTTNSFGFSASAVSAAYGRSRLTGVLTLSFINTIANAGADGGVPQGVVYWQHP